MTENDSNGTTLPVDIEEEGPYPTTAEKKMHTLFYIDNIPKYEVCSHAWCDLWEMLVGLT